jgi:aminopeptidase N
VLNSAEIKFDEASVTSGGSTQTAKVTADDKSEMATLALPNAVAAGPATIHIKFTGILNDQLRGFYLSKTKTRNYAVTQFEATDARRAFPSFDEPAMKATFDITLVVDNGDTAISNEKIVSDSPGPGEGKHTLKFAPTAKMSTYLVALLVGDFQCLEGSGDGVPIRVCATPDKKALGGFALKAAEQQVKFFDQYYGVKYPFGKLDLIALPDFAAGAMENAGAITYREELLLLDDEHASVAAHREVALVTSHEIAHQWFGDLVTAAWWDDIWLNEGFATWMAPKPVAAWKPQWNTELGSVMETNRALNLDALKSTRAIHAASSEANSPEQIAQLFDGIAYGKTAAVLRMLETWVGEENFRKGVARYLKKYAYGSTQSADFWNAMAEASQKPVDKVMPTWVQQAGTPMLSVTAQCSGKQTSVELTQTRFFNDPQQLKQGSPELWQVPVCIKTGSGQAPRCELMTQKHQTLKFDGCVPWVYVNAGGKGYYRSAYSPELTAKLAANAQQALTPAERIVLINDEWALVRTGQHPIGQFLSLAQGFRDDRVRQIVQAISGPVEFLSNRIITEADRDAFRAWAGDQFRPLFAQLGWSAKPGEDDETKSMRTAVITGIGYMARDPQVMRQAAELARQYMKDPASVDANVAGMALNLAALDGDAKLYDAYVAQMKAAKSPEQLRRYLDALTRFRQPELAQRTLEMGLSPEVRSQDMIVLIAAQMSNPETRNVSWQFMKAHWSEIEKKTAGGMGFGFGEFAGAFCSEEEKKDVQQWFAQHPDPGTNRTLRQGLERLDDCVRMKQLPGENLTSWLKQHASVAGK